MALVYFGLNKLAMGLQDPYGKDECDIHLETFRDELGEDFETYKEHWGHMPGDDVLHEESLVHVHDYD